MDVWMMDGCMDGWINVCVEMERWMDGGMDKWMIQRWMDE
jgi:hypothetical protein